MELAANAVHIWLTRIADVPASAIASYHRLMNRDEQARNLRYKHGQLRDANTITRALLRTVLSQYDEYPPSRWEFGTEAHGKPYIASPDTALHFNLSHTTEWIACAVTRLPVLGIDIERCNRTIEVPRLARRFFSPAECRDVLALSGEQRRQRFFDYWTLKEAFIKARGEGISLGLDTFSFGFSPQGAIGIACDEHLREDPGAWHFRLSPRGGDHRLALAAKPPRPTPALEVQHFLSIPEVSAENYTGPMRL